MLTLEAQKGQVVPEKNNDSTIHTVDITFKDVKYSVDTKNGIRQILRGVDGICKAGTLTAILGSSGAGKTTLLNILCQRVKQKKGTNLQGEILANCQPFSQEKFTQFAAYVMQDDVLLETMTVKECFQFAANLKTKGTVQEKEAKVDEIIKSLRLERCQNTFVGGLFVKGISGGEKKRTSIGYEMVSDPCAIFLDEPTSGLDSFTAFSIVNLLRKFAHEKNKTVVFTIHQPSADIWNLFDKVMLMVEGQFIYQGHGGIDVVNHFASIGFKCPTLSNPADYLMRIMHHENETNVKNYPIYFEGYKSKLQDEIELGISSSISGQIPSKLITSSFSYQIQQLALRQCKILNRNPILTRSRFFQSIMIGLFIGAIYWQLPNSDDHPSTRDLNDKAGFLFFYLVGMFMMTLNPCILTFPAERAVFLREENAKLYTVETYFLGKFLVDIIPTIIFPIICSVVAYWMVGLNSENPGTVLFFFLVCILMSCTALGVGYLVGSAFSDAKIAIAVMPLFIMPFMLFAGFYKNSADFASWIGWFQYLSPFKYSFIAVSINEFTTSHTPYNPNPIETLNFSLNRWESVGCLAGLFSFYTLAAFIFLATLKKRVQ